MKRICLIIGSFLAMANAFANNELASTSKEVIGTMNEVVEFSCKDCMLNFGEISKVVISDDEGHVIFYNERVQDIDLSDWHHGSYVVKVNDKETFEFTL